MKNCIRCSSAKDPTAFDNDRSRPDGRFPICKECRREIKGSKKRRTREPRICAKCSIEFFPRTAQIDTNKHGKFFCCHEHYLVYSREHAVTNYTGYRPYIIERDGGCCCLCEETESLHVHHIHTRGSGGSDEYKNLITLCRLCHQTKAHGIDGASFKQTFLKITAQYERPDFWDEVIAQSTRDRQAVKETNKRYRQESYKRLKQSSNYQAFRTKRKAYLKGLNQAFKEKHGCSYHTFRKREAKKKMDERTNIHHIPILPA